MSAVRPPRVAERLLSWTAGLRTDADAVLGDLQEEFAAFAGRHGVPAARRWYWRNAAGLALHFAVGLRARRRRRATFMDVEPSTGRWRPDLRHDVRAAWRGIVQTPGVSATIVLTLAVGLAANATIFALGDAIVLRPFRFAGVNETVVVASSGEELFFDRSSVSPGDFTEWRDRASDVFTELAAIETWDANLSGTGPAEQLPAFKVSSGFFEVMGVRAAIGRTFTPEDERVGSPRIVVLSHGLWVRRFGADPQIVGRTVRLDGEPSTVIGVAPGGFALPQAAALWAPLVLSAEDRAPRADGWLTVAGRLRPGITLATARARMDAIVAEQRQASPATHARKQVTVRTYTNGFGDPGAPAFIAVWQAAALLLLLVTCANVTNLLLARGLERQREFAIRLALGASRLRLAHQTLLEGGLLAAGAIVPGVLLAWMAVEATRSMFPPAIVRYVPGWEYLHLEPLTVLVTAALAGLATIASALIPALRSARAAVVDDLRPGARLTDRTTRHRLRAILAGVQIALTVALLTGAGLTVSAVQRVTRGPLGFSPDQVLTAQLTLAAVRYDDATSQQAFVREVLERLHRLPGVNAAAVINALPYSGTNWSGPFWPERVQLERAEVRNVDVRRVTPGWAATLRVPLVRGRALSEADRADTPPVALVSGTLAERYWPGRDAIGRRFRLEADGPWISVVGVVGEVARYWIGDRTLPTVYVPLAQSPSRDIAVIARTAGDPMAFAGVVRAIVAGIDPEQPVAAVQSYPQVVADSTFGLRFAARALLVIAVVAFLVAVVGIYSLMQYLTSRRTRELGVRVALGATRGDITRLTVGMAARIAAGGALLGCVLALAGGRLLESALFGVVWSDYRLTALVALALGLAAVAASYLPARRASTVDPLVALRTE